jgi:RHS repeat-associated protein
MLLMLLATCERPAASRRRRDPWRRSPFARLYGFVVVWIVPILVILMLAFFAAAQRGSDTPSWDGWGRLAGGTFGAIIVSYSSMPLASAGSAPLGRKQHAHGDLVAKANAAGARTASYTYDPFGAPADAVTSNARTERWSARWDKKLDTASSLVEMGARPYDPAVGRFYAPDPVEGGAERLRLRAPGSRQSLRSRRNHDRRQKRHTRPIVRSRIAILAFRRLP